MSLRVVQLTDTHLAVDAPARSADLTRCIDAINALPEQPELVIHTGDITHHGSAAEYRQARAGLDRLRAPYVVLPGNKDVREPLRQEFSNAPYLAAGASFIQYSVEDFPVRLLLLDTLSSTSRKGEFCAHRVAHLQQMLNADTGRPVVLFMHHPPFAAEEIPDPWQFERWDEVERLLELVARYHNVKAIVCGHVHRNIDTTVAGLPARALTCLAGDLRKGKVSDAERQQPVFREYVL